MLLAKVGFERALPRTTDPTTCIANNILKELQKEPQYAM